MPQPLVMKPVQPPGSNYVPLFGFWGAGKWSFEEVVTALKGGSAPIKITVETPQRTVHGLALEVDESGILRVGHLDQSKRPGVRVLIFCQDGELFGEFASP